MSDPTRALVDALTSSPPDAEISVPDRQLSCDQLGWLTLHRPPIGEVSTSCHRKPCGEYVLGRVHVRMIRMPAGDAPEHRLALAGQFRGVDAGVGRGPGQGHRCGRGWRRVTHMPTVNRGRVNHGADVLRDLHAETFSQPASRTDMAWYRVVVSAVLAADDRYIAHVTAVADGRLREHLGKAHQEISRLGQEIERLNHRIRDASDRRRKADAAIAEAEQEKRKAESWRLSAEANTKAFNIVRAQLEEAGIEIDRRVR